LDVAKVQRSSGGLDQMRKRPALVLPALELVSVPLGDLIVPGDDGLPRVLKLPSRSENADRLIALVIAAQTPVVGPPLQDGGGPRHVLANAATVALVRALLPVSERRSYELPCLEWKDAPGDFRPLDAPHAVLGLMVKLPKIPPTHELKREMRKGHGLSLRKPRALDELASSSPDQPR
jgi:hypothetical protein